MPYLAPDTEFSDAPREGRPPVLTQTQQQAVMNRLERDLPDAIPEAARHFGVSETTIWRIGHSLGDLVSRDYAVHVSEDHCRLRVNYAKSQLGTDHTKQSWFDHTVGGSTRSTGTKSLASQNFSQTGPTRFETKKQNTAFDGVDRGWCSLRAIFAVQAVCRKRNTSRGRKGQLRYETYTVDGELMEIDLETHIFPFMEKHGSEELIMDNASCQDGLKDFIERKGFESPGFPFVRRQQENGYSPNSPDFMLLDACIFGRFKVLYKHAAPKTVPEAMKAAKKKKKKIVKSMQGMSKNWIKNLDDLYREVIENEGEGPHLMCGCLRCCCYKFFQLFLHFCVFFSKRHF